MGKALYLLLGLCLFGAAGPIGANVIVQPTFQEKLAQAELVVIGTVAAQQRDGLRGSVTIRVLLTLKGAPGEMLDVVTSHGTPEMDPPCCVVGAAYLFFLSHARDGRLVAVGGPGGIMMVGGVPNAIQPIPAREMQ